MADPSAGPEDTKVRVLVAEDEEAVREFVVRALQSQGYEVTAVGDGSEALRELRKDEFDVLVSDIVMPEIDGISLAVLVIMQAKTATVPRRSYLQSKFAA